MAKVYLSGAIENDPNFMENFAKAEEMLKGFGYEVVNPTRVSGAVEYFDYADFMITCLMLLKKCDTVYFLSNWKKSDGCKIEKTIAQKLGIKILHENYMGLTNPNRRKRTRGQDSIVRKIIEGENNDEING